MLKDDIQQTSHRQTLDIIRISFPQFLLPYLPDLLSSVLNHLNVLFPTYYHFNVIAEESAPSTSEEDPIELSQLAGVCLDFIAGVARRAGTKKWFSQAHLFALVSAIVPWAEITNDDVSSVPETCYLTAKCGLYVGTRMGE